MGDTLKWVGIIAGVAIGGWAVWTFALSPGAKEKRGMFRNIGEAIVADNPDDKRRNIQEGIADGVEALKKQYPDPKTRPKQIQDLINNSQALSRMKSSPQVQNTRYTSSYYALANAFDNKTRDGGEVRIAMA